MNCLQRVIFSIVTLIVGVKVKEMQILSITVLF